MNHASLPVGIPCDSIRSQLALALDERLSAKDAVARCGLLIVDIDTGHILEWLRFEHTIEELYAVAVLPRVRAAEAIGFKSDDIQREITVGGT